MTLEKKKKRKKGGPGDLRKRWDETGSRRRFRLQTFGENKKPHEGPDQ